MSNLQTYAAPMGRILIGMLFVMAGVMKISGYAGTQGYMEAMGVPGMLLPLVILLEVGGGMAVIVGYKTRIAAFLLAGFSLLAAILFHADFANQVQMTFFLKNVSI
ncbi:MAG: DoxX family protein, partial [Rhodospirillaceae bacterium]|nr:DoxX family protein [Rhodospirillaceae bacterium]